MSDKRSGASTTRRTLVKGAAWSVPAVTLAVPASATVTSPPPEPPPCLAFTFSSDSSRCTQGGPGADYILTFCVTSTCQPGVGTGTVTIRLSDGVFNQSGEPLIPYPGCTPYGDVTIPIAPGGTACTPQSYRFSSTGSAANNLVFSISLNGGPDVSRTVPAPINCVGGRFDPPINCTP